MSQPCSTSLYSTDSALTRVFVYGTLKPGESNFELYCAATVVEWREAIAFGQLFDLPIGYPAMTLGNQPIQGVLLIFPDSTVLTRLDQLEDYVPSRALSENEYSRDWIEVLDREGRSLGHAWGYRMAMERVQQYGGQAISTGHWTGLKNGGRDA